MKSFSVMAIALMTGVSAPALLWAEGETTRQLGSHEHGAGTLNIAIDGDQLLMEFTAPGADIVGFEYEATSEADLNKIEAAIAQLSDPLALFSLSEGAQCVVADMDVDLITEADDHDDHDHGKDHQEHAEHDDHDQDKDHEEHADHDDHDHDKEHAEHADHEEHADHDAHDNDKDHEEHAAEASHSEFEAQYQFTCANPSALTGIEFAYFDIFENAQELAVQVVTATSAQAFEVERDQPRLELTGL